VLIIVAAMMSALVVAQPTAAQTQQSPAPYKAVAVTVPEPLKDPSFGAFRAELGKIAERKDRAALARLVVSKGFFWERESGNSADPKKSGIANFAAAIGLDSPDDPDTGWDTIAIYAEDATVFDLPDRPGVVCGPADPDFDETEVEALLEATGTDISDWVYPVKGGINLHAAPRPDAAVVEKVGLTFIRLLAPEGAGDQADPVAAEFARVVLPSGTTGFVKITDVASLGVSQFCYVKEDGAWKIAGVIGGEE
jgi:hypothetical protein